MNLYLDDIRSPPITGEWTLARSVGEAKRLLEQSTEPFIRASLDHDLGYVYCRPCAFRDAEEPCGDGNGGFSCDCPCHVEAPSGMDFLKWIQATGRWPENRPVIHSANRPAAERMEAFVNDYGPYQKSSS